MLYDIRQVTQYSYASPVPFARQVLRLLPVERAGQRVIAADLSITPSPTERHDGFDFFGNRITTVAFAFPHEELKLETRARVLVEKATRPDPAATPPWEHIRRIAVSETDLGPRSPVHFLFASRLIAIDNAIGAYVAKSFPAGRPIFEAAFDLTKRIKADFNYDPEATDVKTLPADAFAKRAGVCQDFAHVMIAGLRTLGLPAAYVSGFLRTEPPPGRPRLEGADATHAWVAVWCGRGAGWIGLDPTNGVVADEDHVVLALGRDYVDAAPADGVIVTSGDHTLDVAVDVIPVEG
ncbi:transglutaminase family protein [Kaistia dalseonensis]|uniref:Transglutaminase-like putative cysteine protease n=1 Tax=Kaistia dalseonensis TaxID=410840 RepID=A0ABU0H842_9HYPH|nr:transglutaminase family protein [Kaistia dalseonensis]MCX5495087.1 transglutaminase family protein [Kaistia dalseonensis]MDQ0437669.1 transglutaminase-like putative cysteine protease [Kaistia dalseonensis]